MRAKIFGAMAPAWRVLLTGLILAGLLSGTAMADKAITGINVTNKADRVIITVRGNSPLKMTVIPSNAGKYLAFQFAGTLSPKGRIVGIHSGRILNVRYTNFRPNPPATRLVVNISGCLNYSTQWSNNRTQVDISVWKYGVKPASQPQADAAVPAPVNVARPAVAMAPALMEEARPAPVMALVDHTAKGSDTGDEPAPQVKRELRPQTVAMLATAAPELPGNVSDSRKVSLNFLGADINDVLKAISVQSGRNIVSSKDVTGSVTISLSDVSVDQAMDYVAKFSGYSYAKLNDTYVVGSKASVQSVSDGNAEQAKVQVVALNYTNVDDAMAFLDKEFPEMKTTKGSNSSKKEGDDKGQPSPGGTIVMSGPEGIVSQASQMVAQIDESMKNLMGAMLTDVYNVKHVNGVDLAKTLTALLPGKVNVNFGPSEGFDLQAPDPIKVESTGGSKVETPAAAADTEKQPRVQRLVISGRESDVKQAMDLAAKLDVKSPQVRIEAKVTSLTETGEKKLGLSWDWSSFNFNESIELVSLPPEGTKFDPVTKPSNHYYRNPLSIGATLDALIQEGNGQLLAAPSLMCLEGKPGVFFVGDEVTYIIRVETTPTGQNVVTQTANVGVQLRVIADVSPDGSITLNLHPEVSVLKLNTDQAANITLPIITRRFTDHVIRVKDGETIVIGGLIRDDELESLDKIPILGDLPVLGHLFRHKEKSKSHSEVVIFITASVVND